ncbi:hypothetical protein FRC09_012614 [Ceratobasidium sp. 395]|nr:hypothetical protein FRC09_012614 [Ceratobasidium sp. 395]
MSETIHPSLVLSELSTDVLSQVQVFNLLMQLDKLLRTLPSSLPLPASNDQSHYAKLLSFHPLSSSWLEDIGIVGTVNRQLEIVFGTRAFGFTLKERGSALESVVPILRQYLFAHPGDIILQKWLRDLVQAALNAHSTANQSTVPNDKVMDLTGDTTDDDGLPSGAALLTQACRSKRGRSNSPVPDDSASEEQDTVETKPGNKKRRKTHVKRKGPLPPQDDIKVIPPKTDPRVIDLPELDHDPSKGGAPPNLLVRKLTKRCYRLGNSPAKFLFRCVASSKCRHYFASRHSERVFKHASRCDDLKRMQPELHSRATQAMAKYLDSASSPGSLTKSTTPSHPPSQPDTDASSTSSDVFAAFRDKGKLDFGSEATLAAIRFVCATGVPPRILDSPEWRRYNDILLAKISGHRYHPPSATTMSDKLIPARAAQVTLDVQRILSKQHNLTISFDGLTKGNQSFYSVHVTTSDRHVFFYMADVFRGAHNSDYVESLLNTVASEIGVSRITAVVSDDTNTVKKARRDFANRHPSVINLADPIHKLHLIAKDICLDPEWDDMHKTNRAILNFFGHSTQASTRLSEARADSSIRTGLVSMSKSRFGHAYLTVDSVRINLPAMHLAHRKGLFSTVPTRLDRVFDESSIQATQFKMVLLQFTLILEPIYRALTCLESSNCTLADVFAYWTALLGTLDRHLSSDECTLSQGVVSRFRAMINTRYLEAFTKAPTTDVYLLAFYLHPDFRNADVFRRTNPLSSKLCIRIPAPNPISPAPHIPDSVYIRIRQAGSQLLRQSLKAAESDPTHPLHGYDAQDAKTEYDNELSSFGISHHPFHRPLGDQESPLAYWRSLRDVKGCFVLSIIAEKLFSVLPNSMCDERTGSRFTFLDSDLRSRSDVKTMTEQIKVMQWYSMVEGRTKPKPRTPARFRDLPDASKSLLRQQQEAEADEGECVDDPADLFEDEPSQLDPEPHAECGVEELTDRLSALEIINLQSPHLADMLSASAVTLPSSDDVEPEEGSSIVEGKAKERVRTVDEVKWD